VLLISTVLGAIVGYIVGEPIKVIKPLGELFYRLLFMVVPALVFFSIASSFAGYRMVPFNYTNWDNNRNSMWSNMEAGTWTPT